MDKLIVATGNSGKLKEISEIMKELDITVISMKDFGINIDIEENGTSFEENALIKARTVHKLTGQMVMADDSGLEVDALNGRPGIFSARFAGEHATDQENNIKLISMLKDIPYQRRTARYVCSIAVCFKDGRELTTRGTCEGIIINEPKGSNGFGYDPYFYIPDYHRTVAELNPDIKNSISHRGKALRLMFDKIKEVKI